MLSVLDNDLKSKDFICLELIKGYGSKSNGALYKDLILGLWNIPFYKNSFPQNVQSFPQEGEKSQMVYITVSITGLTIKGSWVIISGRDEPSEFTFFHFTT